MNAMGVSSHTPEYHRLWRKKNAAQLNATARAYYAKNGDDLRAKAKVRREKNRPQLLEYGRRWRENHPNSHRSDPALSMLRSAKARAKKRGLAFDLTREDIAIPSLCPVLGIELVQGVWSGFIDSSPTLDRIDSAGGYTRGNVVVISWRANRIKCDATVSEMKKLYDFYSARDL